MGTCGCAPGTNGPSMTAGTMPAATSVSSAPSVASANAPRAAWSAVGRVPTTVVAALRARSRTMVTAVARRVLAT